jgi:hypothetical protein
MKHSRHERLHRKQVAERVREIESAWARSVPPAVAEAFAQGVAEARARGPEPKRPDMAPGTPPRPPRPGREPKPVADNDRPRRRRS